MFIDRVNQQKSRAFTLLEITLAVAILAMVAMAIYRFVVANMAAVQISAAEVAADSRFTGFISLLTSQMESLSTEGGLLGEPFKFNDQAQDEMSWVSGSGPGLLTRYAEGEYIVSMRLKREQGSNSDKWDVGFVRKPRDTPEGSEEGQSWVPVLENVRSMQIRYYDPRLPAWVEKWTDTNVMPRLVRLVIGRSDRSQPVETIIALGRTPLQIMPQMPQMPQTPTAPNQNPPGVGGVPPPTGKDGRPGGNPGGQPPPKK